MAALGAGEEGRESSLLSAGTTLPNLRSVERLKREGRRRKRGREGGRKERDRVIVEPTNVIAAAAAAIAVGACPAENHLGGGGGGTSGLVGTSERKLGLGGARLAEPAAGIGKPGWMAGSHDTPQREAILLQGK